jgi:hypothetical protein
MKFMRMIFKTMSPMFFGIFFGAVLMILGLFFLAIEPLIGILAVSLAIIIPVLAYFFGTQEIIECGEEGFSLERMNKRKGNTKEFFPWASVTETRYYEIQQTDSKNGTRSIPYFEVHCDGDLAMKQGKISKFSQLIKIFNEKTPQLSYTWEPQLGFNFSFGIRREAYHKVPRAGSPSPEIPQPVIPSGPPPLPNS